jgi:TRAP transporter T-component
VTLRIEGRLFLGALLAMLMTGCINTGAIANHLGQAMQKESDPRLVADAIPAYLILVRSLLEGSEDNPALWLANAKLYNAYGMLLSVEDPEALDSIKNSINQGFRASQKAACLHSDYLCGIEKLTFEDFNVQMKKAKAKDIVYLYALATSWAGWIQQNSADWNALAALPNITVLFHLIESFDASYQNGMPLVYLGVLSSLLPPSMGGKPEEARNYFEQAISLSKGKNLLAKVYYAKSYARLVFDKKLHDQLLEEVLKEEPGDSALTLMNVLAQREAKRLLTSAEDYF